MSEHTKQEGTNEIKTGKRIKKLRVSFVVLLIFLCISVTGVVTYALYATQAERIGGSATAKEFIITGAGSEDFNVDLKIAPEEKIIKTFIVRNYKGDAVSETAMTLEIVVSLLSAEGKSHIKPLKLAVFKDGRPQGTAIYGDSASNLTFMDEMNATATELTYVIEVYWESTDSDIDYAGGDYADIMNIQVTARQKT